MSLKLSSSIKQNVMNLTRQMDLWQFSSLRFIQSCDKQEAAETGSWELLPAGSPGKEGMRLVRFKKQLAVLFFFFLKDPALSSCFLWWTRDCKWFQAGLQNQMIPDASPLCFFVNLVSHLVHQCFFRCWAAGFTHHHVFHMWASEMLSQKENNNICPETTACSRSFPLFHLHDRLLPLPLLAPN